MKETKEQLILKINYLNNESNKLNSKYYLNVAKLQKLIQDKKEYKKGLKFQFEVIKQTKLDLDNALKKIEYIQELNRKDEELLKSTYEKEINEKELIISRLLKEIREKGND